MAQTPTSPRRNSKRLALPVKVCWFSAQIRELQPTWLRYPQAIATENFRSPQAEMAPVHRAVSPAVLQTEVQAAQSLAAGMKAPAQAPAHPAVAAEMWERPESSACAGPVGPAKALALRNRSMSPAWFSLCQKFTGHVMMP